jgi:hypothetical protein
MTFAASVGAVGLAEGAFVMAGYCADRGDRQGVKALALRAQTGIGIGGIALTNLVALATCSTRHFADLRVAVANARSE